MTDSEQTKEGLSLELGESSSSGSSSGGPTQFTASSITQGVKTSVPGKFKVGPEGFGWKANDGRSLPLHKSEVQSCEWRQIGPRVWELVVLTTGGSRHKFGGFKEGDYEAGLASAIRSGLGRPLARTELSSEGLNWGEIGLWGTNLTFKVNARPDFELNLSDVSTCSAGKNEVTLKFHEFHTVDNKNADQLCEMRLFVSPTNHRLRVKDDDEDVASPAHKLQVLIQRSSGLDSDQGASRIAMLGDVKLTAPRGKVDLEFYSTYLTIHGASAEFKILYESIVRVHFLPRPPFDVLILSVSPPLRKGAVLYPHLIMEFPRTESIELPINLTSAEAQKFAGRLPEQLSGDLGDTAVKICSTLFNKAVTLPGSFLSTQKNPFVRCSVKANDGILYFLERAFFFIIKPATYIRYDDIDSIEFTRVTQVETGSNRNFDLRIMLKTGIQHEFNHLSRAEYSNVFNFLAKSGIRIKGTKGQAARPTYTAADEDDEEDDEDDEDDADFVAGDEEDDDDFQGDEDDSDQAAEESGGDDDAGGATSHERPKAKRQRS